MRKFRSFFKRVVLIFFVLFSITQLHNTVCLAAEDVEVVGQFSKVIEAPEDYDPKPDEVNPGGKYNKKVGVILGIIRAVGIVTSVIALMIIGIRMMTLSIEEKAIYKESLPGYILGVVMVVAFSVIPSIIYDIFFE